ncbi:MAG: hypothetical protein ABSG31_02020 [Tepidisphaeraceae bacterium]|jgi:hypothetical protein
MELQNALSQIARIKSQMARTRTFRGYRAGTTLATGLAALGAAIWQMRFIPRPALDPIGFVDLWVAVAVGSIVLVGTEIIQRYRHTESSLERELTIHAAEQFLPCIIVGGLVTMALCDFAPSAIRLLPGLWPIFFGLGLMASRRLLPGMISLVAAFYLLCGLCWLALGRLDYSAWSMGLTFGIGQILSACVLHYSLERHHESQ